jgi:hypothetical protein
LIRGYLENLTLEMTPQNCRAGMVGNLPAMAGRALPIPALQKRDTTYHSGNALKAKPSVLRRVWLFFLNKKKTAPKGTAFMKR